MANRYYGLNRGQTNNDVTEGSSTGSTDVELRVDLSKSFTKSDILMKLVEFAMWIVKGNWPPA